MVNAAAASAQYQRGAAASQNAPASDFAAGAAPSDDDAVDPNLAARAAGLSHAAFDDPVIGAGTRAAGVRLTTAWARPPRSRAPSAPKTSKRSPPGAPGAK